MKKIITRITQVFVTILIMLYIIFEVIIYIAVSLLLGWGIAIVLTLTCSGIYLFGNKHIVWVNWIASHELIVWIICSCIMLLCLILNNFWGDSNFEENSDTLKKYAYKESQKLYDKKITFVDAAGNYRNYGDGFIDAMGNYCQWGTGFYDYDKHYIQWGNTYKDAAGAYRHWGEDFVDGAGNWVHIEH